MTERSLKHKRRASSDAEATVTIRTFGATVSTGQIIPPSSPSWHQLIYSAAGAMTVHTSGGIWVLPPHRALWVPAGLDYRVELSSRVALRMIYVSVRASRSLPSDCCVVNVSPLLRELIFHCVRLAKLDVRIKEQRRLAGVLLDQLRYLNIVPLQLPWPRDPRAIRLAAKLRSDPAADISVGALANQSGGSRRTVERLFKAEVGMSVGQWRRKLRLLYALGLLASGRPVTKVALELNYNSASAFVAMFKRELGDTPKRYLVGNGS
jgi:AraC-like DNA-binding protein